MRASVSVEGEIDRGDELSVSRYISGAYYSSECTIAEQAGDVLEQDQLYLVPFPIWRTGNFDKIAVYQWGATQATLNWRLCVFKDDRSISGDFTVALDAGTLSANTATGLREITIAEEFSRGLYWIGVRPEDAAPAAAKLSRYALPYYYRRYLPVHGLNSDPTQFSTGFKMASTGALATITPTRAHFETQVDMPCVWLRRA